MIHHLKTELFLITTSHNQLAQVSKLLFSLVEHISTNPDLEVHCIISESFLEPSAYADLEISLKKNFKSLGIVSVDSKCYWSGAVFSALDHVLGIAEIASPVNLKRVMIVNCDVMPSSWNFLTEIKSPLETIATVSPNNIVQRSGYRLASPFLAVHIYPFYNKPLPRSDWYCTTVPTRLVIFPLEAVPIILSHRNIAKFLPHYSADFIFTSILSVQLSIPWLVRADYCLNEDISTTGLKSIDSVNLYNFGSVLLGRKSVFNMQDSFRFPILFSTLCLPCYCAPSYILTFWLKYMAKIAYLFARNIFLAARSFSI